jgi:hypothetical protein
MVTSVELLDARPGTGWPGMPLLRENGHTLLASLRRIPLLGRLVPPAQEVRWGVPATYRVQLRRAAAKSCTSQLCIEAILLDPAPRAGEPLL